MSGKLPYIEPWIRELGKVKQCPQRQDSVTDQLRDLRIIANRFGLYDAADYIDNCLKSRHEKK